ncbi:hypothetical protein Tco_0572495 [Tanacetum coccineum]
MFMENQSSANPIYDEAGSSYDSDILSEVQDHDNYVDSVGEYHEVHEMQNDVQPNYVVDLDSRQVQPAHYNGHELVKTKHAPTIVHDSEDTLEIVEITRRKMLEKSKSTMWVDSKIKIAPLDYSKENYLATLTPQRHLTP